MTPRAVSWSITISTKRICGGVRLRSFRNSENAACAAARSMPTRLRTKCASEGASLRASKPGQQRLAVAFADLDEGRFQPLQIGRR